MIKFVGKSIVTNTAEMICEKYFTSNTNRQHQICGENSSDSPKINERPYSRSCYGRLTGFHDTKAANQQLEQKRVSYPQAKASFRLPDIPDIPEMCGKVNNAPKTDDDKGVILTKSPAMARYHLPVIPGKCKNMEFEAENPSICVKRRPMKNESIKAQKTDDDEDIIPHVNQDKSRGGVGPVAGVTQKMCEFQQCVKDEEIRLKKELQTVQRYLIGITSLEGKGETEKLNRMNELISLWNRIKTRKYIEPVDASFSEVQVEDSEKMASNDLAIVQQMYEHLLNDLEGSIPNFIQAVYLDHLSKFVIVDVVWQNQECADVFLRNLSGYDIYQGYLKIVENDPGHSLIKLQNLASLDDCHYSHNLVGNGTYITVIECTEEWLNTLLNDPFTESLSDVLYGRGTLTCISKHNDEFYAMTAQHVLNENNNSPSKKHIISEISYQCDKLYLADVIHLSSSHFGKQGIYGNRKAVDVALMRISQKWLDTSSLKLLPILTRSHVEALFPNTQNLRNQKVVKYGAITGITQGRILSEEMSYQILPNCLGEMFVVEGVRNEDFAAEGDSGALVTINIEGHGGNCEEYALGIVSQSKDAFGVKNACLCVRLEDCLGALQALDKSLLQSEMEVYKGILKPNVGICNKRQPHLTRDQKILVYKK